VTVKKFN